MRGLFFTALYDSCFGFPDADDEGEDIDQDDADNDGKAYCHFKQRIWEHFMSSPVDFWLDIAPGGSDSTPDQPAGP